MVDHDGVLRDQESVIAVDSPGLRDRQLAPFLACASDPVLTGLSSFVVVLGEPYELLHGLGLADLLAVFRDGETLRWVALWVWGRVLCPGVVPARASLGHIAVGPGVSVYPSGPSIRRVLLSMDIDPQTFPW